jgi:hypothetical protein
MDHETAQWYAARLAKSEITVTPATVRESGPLANVWGIRVTAQPDSRVYGHPDSFPPQWRHVLDHACINCGTTIDTRNMYNQMTGGYDAWCFPCFHGDAA